MNNSGSGEVAQWIIPLAILAEDQNSVPSTYMMTHNHL